MRQRAKQARQLLANGIDPLQQRRTEQATRKAATGTRLTFKEACLNYIAQHDAEWSSRKHAQQYLNSLHRFAWPFLGDMDVAEIDVPHVLQVLEQKVPARRGLPAGTLWNVRKERTGAPRNVGQDPLRANSRPFD